MAKRAKRLKKGIESIKEEIERHFKKIEDDIEDKNVDRGRYHVKEIGKGLLKALEIKIKMLGADDNSVQGYRERLEKLEGILEKSVVE